MKLCVVAPFGRMGSEVLQLAEANTNIEIVGLLDAPDSSKIGSTLSGVRVTDEPSFALTGADVYIDFSSSASSQKVATAALATEVAAVVGTTALDDTAVAALSKLSSVAPTLVAANFSLGVNLLVHLTAKAVASLPSFDTEILEIHHKRKVDAPSGTAIALLEAAAEARTLTANEVQNSHRFGITGPRSENEIGVMALRGGDVIGDHTVYLFSDEERLELTHRAANRAVFAKGALSAASWLHGKPPGEYRMNDVLGLT